MKRLVQVFALTGLMAFLVGWLRDWMGAYSPQYMLLGAMFAVPGLLLLFLGPYPRRPVPNSRSA